MATAAMAGIRNCSAMSGGVQGYLAKAHILKLLWTSPSEAKMQAGIPNWAVGNPMFHMDRMAGWLQHACRMEFSHCCFRMGRPLLPIWISSPSGQNFTKSGQNQPKSPKVNMLKFGDVSFDLGFERGRMSATEYVAKMGMLRLTIGSGMLSIGLGP